VSTAIVVVGHGSRDAAANVEFEALVRDYARLHEGLDVSHGYIELASPALPDALRAAARGAERVVILPLLLFASGHVKNDLPLAAEAARAEFPHVHFDVARPFGVHPLLTELLSRRAAEATLLAAEERARTAVLVVGRGSSDPDANGDFCKVVRLFAEGRGYGRVDFAFMGITTPRVDEMLDLTARGRPERLVVVPAMLFGGTLVGKLEASVRAFGERYPWIKTVVAPHLGAHENVFRLMDERMRQALENEAPLPCDTCQYRTPLPGLAEQVGGLKALLWSIRHSFTHTQALPHVHAHRPLRKHVLVCTNADCADRGSLSLVDELRRLLKEVGLERDIRVTRTGCMGRCGEGPTVVVYPDGIWYRGVKKEDAEALLKDHLLSDKLVARLVDNIMQ
jgi:sirohydrochlorin ferrochelatase/(2Fe-2S) ferredoxin